jgi:transposase-like protein
MLHERKFQTLHEQFVSEIARRFPKLSNIPVVVTDGETACINALKKTFPDWKMLNCWNHIVRDAEFALKKRLASASEITVYKAQVRALLQSESMDDFAMRENSFRQTWSQSFVEYFDMNLRNRIHDSCVGALREVCPARLI